MKLAEKGYIALHREITESDIYSMPPLYLRVFERLILEANFKDNHIPYKNKLTNVTGKKLIRRGERLTSLRQIAEWVKWYERGIIKTPNVKTIKQILDWLITNNMIEIYNVNESNRLETHYIVVNYNTYQGIIPAEVTEKKQSLDTNNKDKERKEEINNKPIIKKSRITAEVTEMKESNKYPEKTKEPDTIRFIENAYLSTCAEYIARLQQRNVSPEDYKFIGKFIKNITADIPPGEGMQQSRKYLMLMLFILSNEKDFAKGFPYYLKSNFAVMEYKSLKDLTLAPGTKQLPMSINRMEVL